MTRSLFVYLVLLISNCIVIPDATTPAVDTDRAVVDTTIQEWTTEGFPYRTQCRKDYLSMRVTRTSGNDFLELCGKSTHFLYGCYRRTDGSSRWGIPLLTLSSTQSARIQDRTLVHEALHWLIDCNGVGYGADPYHTLEPVWGPLQERAKDRVAP